MKKVKKIMALVLAAIMVMAMGMTAFAADPDYSITVTNAKEGETYKAFKMFDLSVDDPTNPTAFRYTVSPKWDEFAETAEFRVVFTVYKQGYVTSTKTSQPQWEGDSDLSKVIDSAAKFAATKGIQADGSVTIASGETSGKITLKEAGYYVVSSTLGTRAMVDTTPANPAVTIHEKNEEDSIVKTVKEDKTGEYGETNDAQIGDTVEFKSVVTIAARSINVKIHDTMDSGLTLNPNSIKVYTNEELTTEYTAAVIKTGSDVAQGDTFTIEIPNTFAETATASQHLYITYTAELNKNAISSGASEVGIVEQLNKTNVTFGNNTKSADDTTTTTTHKFNVHKFAKGVTNLADAVFQMKKNGIVVNLVKIDDTNYRVVDDMEIGTPSSHANNGKINNIPAGTIVSDFVSVSSGSIVIWGVDSDIDYTLKELQAPNGYNIIEDDIEVSVAADNSTTIEIKNETGAELPSTGGIGTTLFYVVGSVLVIGAGVLLVAKRRMKER